MENYFVAKPVLEYDRRLQQQSVKTGATMIISVDVSGVPTPKVTWKLNGNALEKSFRVTTETKEAYSTITVKNLTVEDSGTYSVIAENEAGSDSAEFAVQVKGNLSILMDNLFIICIF